MEVKNPGMSKSINITNKNFKSNNMYMPHHLVSMQDLNISDAQ